MTNDYIEIGQIYREHGLKGLAKVYIYSKSDENLIVGNEYLLKSEQGQTVKTKLLQVSHVKKFFLLHFDCFDGADQIVNWRKALLFVHKSHLQNDDDEMFAFEWQGYKVYDAQKNFLGDIQTVVYNPLAQFVLEKDSKEFLVPWVDEWILEHDQKNKKLILDLPEGLVEV